MMTEEIVIPALVRGFGRLWNQRAMPTGEWVLLEKSQKDAATQTRRRHSRDDGSLF